MQTECPAIEFDNQHLRDEVTAALSELPEFAQEEFFSDRLRIDLVERLQLHRPEWQSLIANIWRNIARHGFVVIRNLPFDANNRLSVALASLLGTPVAHNSRVPELVREIHPRHDGRPLENYPHTDSPHWRTPNDLITLQCKAEDQHLEVYSRIVPIWEVQAELERRDPALVERLFQSNYPFLLIADDGDGGFQIQPVLRRAVEGGHAVTHVRFCLTDARTSVSRFDLDDSTLRDLEIVEAVAEEIGEAQQFLFKRGDWLLFDNKRTFHSKTPTSPDTVRTLKKIKLSADRERMYRFREYSD